MVIPRVCPRQAHRLRRRICGWGLKFQVPFLGPWVCCSWISVSFCTSLSEDFYWLTWIKEGGSPGPSQLWDGTTHVFLKWLLIPTFYQCNWQNLAQMNSAMWTSQLFRLWSESKKRNHFPLYGEEVDCMTQKLHSKTFWLQRNENSVHTKPVYKCNRFTLKQESGRNHNI